jgi:hypothetical protein
VDVLRLRYAEIQRLARKEVFTEPVPFVILPAGLQELGSAQPSQAKSSPKSSSVSEAVQAEHELPYLPVELSQLSQVHSPNPRKKRKASELDSQDEDEEEADASDSDGPQLPGIHLLSSQGEDEMILETHETAVLRMDRHARIRGSEDEMLVPWSDVEGNGTGVDSSDEE